jgi:hypothetical protein
MYFFKKKANINFSDEQHTDYKSAQASGITNIFFIVSENSIC